jgi:UPF0755 protein
MKKRAIALLLVPTVAGLLLVIYFFIFKDNVTARAEPFPLEIRSGTPVGNIVRTLKDSAILKNGSTLQILLSILPKESIEKRSARYLIRPGMSNLDIYRKLRSGAQDPVRLVIQEVRDVYQFSGKVAAQMEMDSMELVSFLLDTILLDSLGYTAENILTSVLPDTYEFYWNSSPQQLYKKLKAQHDRYWASESKAIALKELGLDTKQIYIVASIVEKESQFEPERPAIAGVYLNRLKSGMRLQADPTAVFASGLEGIQRVSHEILSIQSPYNTYQVDGLPPGPICMPSLNSLESVIKAEKHEYLFFCAKPGYEGRHAFAQNAEQHFENARIYRKWLNDENIH